VHLGIKTVDHFPTFFRLRLVLTPHASLVNFITFAALIAKLTLTTFLYSTWFKSNLFKLLHSFLLLLPLHRLLLYLYKGNQIRRPMIPDKGLSPHPHRLRTAYRPPTTHPSHRPRTTHRPRVPGPQLSHYIPRHPQNIPHQPHICHRPQTTSGHRPSPLNPIMSLPLQRSHMDSYADPNALKFYQKKVIPIFFDRNCLYIYSVRPGPW
jgi:hypothetical protein